MDNHYYTKFQNYFSNFNYYEFLNVINFINQILILLDLIADEKLLLKVYLRLEMLELDTLSMNLMHSILFLIYEKRKLLDYSLFCDWQSFC